MTALGERLSAAVGTSLTGKGVIPEDHPLSVGVAGSMGAAPATAALAEADVVLLIGSKASGGVTANWSLPRSDQAVLQLDIDPAELGRAFPLEAGMLGDAQAGVLALSAALANRRSPSQTGPPGGSDWRPWPAAGAISGTPSG